MTVYNFSGVPDNTDLGDVTDWTRQTGSANDIETNSSENLDFSGTAAEQCYTVNVGTADHFVESTYATAASFEGFVVAARATDSSNFIGIRYFGKWNAFKRVAGTFTSLGELLSGVNAPVDTDRIKVTAEGNNINFYLNDVLLLGPFVVTDHNTVTTAGVVGRNSAALDIISQIEIAAISAGPTLTGPDTTTVNAVRVAAGTGLDTVTTAGLKISDDSYSKSLTIDSQTATTLNQTDTIDAGISLGTPVNSLPVEADVLAAGATPYQIQQWVNDAVNPEVARNITLNYLANHTTVQAMIATSNTTPSESLLATNIIAVEDDMQFSAPNVVDTVTITYAADGTLTTDKDQTISFNVRYWSPSTGQASLASITVLGSAIIGSKGARRISLLGFTPQIHRAG